MPSPSILLDRATAAREVAILVALTLIRTKGDPDDALTILDEFSGTTAEEDADGVLDAAAIGGQAVRDAVAMLEGG